MKPNTNTETKREAGHTPGPWHYGIHSREVWTDGLGRSEVIAIIPNRPLSSLLLEEIDQANARLIAAAPELLAACKALCRAAIDRAERGEG